MQRYAVRMVFKNGIFDPNGSMDGCEILANDKYGAWGKLLDLTFAKRFALKKKYAYLLIALILVADQTLKIWVKTHMALGDEFPVIGHWFRIHFIENEGMAYGLQFGGPSGKLMLSLFRLAAVIFGFFVLHRIIREGYPKGLVICGALILAGAIGNLLDSMFYGLIFSESDYGVVAHLFPKGGGYAGFLHGKVVDMLYFPIYEGFLPRWIPFKGGEYFIFFQPVFNISDASISVGVIAILLFQKRWLHKPVASSPANAEPAEQHSLSSSENQSVGG
ncbi:lipoprotein signal peptidase [Thermoflavifilum thermophilum]|nr:lipoprotein signal peptidase [Thermoflavifilum thermophilum]